MVQAMFMGGDAMSGSRQTGALLRKWSVVLAVCLGSLEMLALWRARWVQHRLLHREQRRALG
jgi:hypothetical protein